MKLIKLTKKEFDYLIKSKFINSETKSKLAEKKTKENEYYKIKISEELSEEIRDKCGEQLQIAGFDENYQTNEEGRILESLIDKLYSE